MPQLPRIAVGTVQTEVNSQAITWGLMGTLTAKGLQVQHFLSQACFAPLDGASAVTGVHSRHLDTWLMSPAVCREVFAHSGRASDVSLVEGRYSSARDRSAEPGGNLDLLCQWLDLPCLAIVDVSRLAECRLPTLPAETAGVLLDRVADDSEQLRLETKLESLWGVPVLGALGILPGVRDALARLPRGSVPPRELCQELSREFAKHVRLGRIRRVLDRRSFPPVAPRLFRDCPEGVPLRVAVAYDQAFNCYFPDALERLERMGATVVDFSPLRDESLPGGVDVVYLGCGHPERLAEPLANNHCMSLALREHICRGGRVYAEGGGLAYLCQHIETPDGRRWPMVGALPALAKPNPNPRPAEPVEVTLARSNWLGRPGTRLRGYLNANWLLEPASGLYSYLAEPGHERDLVGRYHAVGSRLHLHFAFQPDCLRSFFHPLPTCADAAKGRTVVF